MTKKRIVFTATLLMAFLSMGITSIWAGGEQEKPGEVVNIRFMTSHDISFRQMYGPRLFQKYVEEELADRINLEFKGGPEAIPAAEQFEALQAGVVDLLFSPGAYHSHVVPERHASEASMLDPVEEREAGVPELLNKIYDKHGVVYLGRNSGYTTFYMYLAKEIDPENPDWSALTIRVSPVYEPFVAALGASPTLMAPSDAYTALERGAVDGMCWSSFGGADFGFHEVNKYRVIPSFYSGESSILMNKESWNNLPADLQDELIEIVKRIEKEIKEPLLELMKVEERIFKEAGVEDIVLAPDVAEEFIKTAIEAKWAKVLETAPEYGPQLKKLLTDY